jgi:hypothetical protein
VNNSQKINYGKLEILNVNTKHNKANKHKALLKNFVVNKIAKNEANINHQKG